MKCTSCNRSPQQIPLQQLPFTYEAKPQCHYRAFWAMIKIQQEIYIHLESEKKACKSIRLLAIYEANWSNLEVSYSMNSKKYYQEIEPVVCF